MPNVLLSNTDWGTDMEINTTARYKAIRAAVIKSMEYQGTDSLLCEVCGASLKIKRDMRTKIVLDSVIPD